MLLCSGLCLCVCAGLVRVSRVCGQSGQQAAAPQPAQAAHQQHATRQGPAVQTALLVAQHGGWHQATPQAHHLRQARGLPSQQGQGRPAAPARAAARAVAATAAEPPATRRKGPARATAGVAAAAAAADPRTATSAQAAAPAGGQGTTPGPSMATATASVSVIGAGTARAAAVVTAPRAEVVGVSREAAKGCLLAVVLHSRLKSRLVSG